MPYLTHHHPAAAVLARHRRRSEYRADCTCGVFFSTSPVLLVLQADHEAHVLDELANAGHLIGQAPPDDDRPVAARRPEGVPAQGMDL
jgi:hypothetical protein